MVKTLTIKTEVYEKLVKEKMPEESFSDLFERLLETASPAVLLKRMRGSVVWKNKDRMLEEIRAKRAGRRFE